MQNFLKTMTEWMLDKEEEMAKSCAVPLTEIDHQIEKIEKQKEKLQQRYDEGMATLNEFEARLQKIKNSEILRCQNKAI